LPAPHDSTNRKKRNNHNRKKEKKNNNQKTRTRTTTERTTERTTTEKQEQQQQQQQQQKEQQKEPQQKHPTMERECLEQYCQHNTRVPTTTHALSPPTLLGTFVNISISNLFRTAQFQSSGDHPLLRVAKPQQPIKQHVQLPSYCGC
jgi:hypothetical protein